MNYYRFSINDIVIFMVGGVFTAQKGWKHNLRYHQGDYELIICTKGPLFITVGDQDYRLASNELLLVPPYALMKGSQPSPNDIEFYWLHFILPKDTQLVKNIDPVELSGDDAGASRLLIPEKIRMANLDQLLILSHQLLNTDIQNPYDRKTANYLATMMLLEISKLTLSQLTTDRTSEAERISRVKEWIRTNLYRSPSVLDMANEVQLNPQYFSRLFKRITGIPPKKYLLQLKLQTAQALLIRTSLSIKEISDNAYFENEKLFMRQFKQFTGVTPSEYRAQFDQIYHNNQVISPTLPIPEAITKHLKDVPDFGRAPKD